MPRKPLHTENAGITITDADTPQLGEMRDAQNQLTLRRQEIIDQYGDGLPYDRQRVLGEVAIHWRAASEAMLQIGKSFVLIKEHETPEYFRDFVENVAGLSMQTAYKWMNAAIKYLSPQLQWSMPVMARLGNSKLFELMAEDNDDLAALADGGTVAGLTLDEIDRMTQRELKAALREARENADAKERLLADKNTRLDELTARSIKRQQIALTDWPEEFTGYLAQVQEARRAIETSLGALDIIRADAMLITAATGEEAALEKARNALGMELASTISRAEDVMGAVRHTFDRTLGALIGD